MTQIRHRTRILNLLILNLAWSSIFPGVLVKSTHANGLDLEFRLVENFESFRLGVVDLNYQIRTRIGDENFPRDLRARNQRVLDRFESFGNLANEFIRSEPKSTRLLPKLLSRLSQGEMYLQKHGFTEAHIVQRSIDRLKILLAESIRLTNQDQSNAGMGGLDLALLRTHFDSLKGMYENLMIEIRRQQRLTEKEIAEGYDDKDLRNRHLALVEMERYGAMLAGFDRELSAPTNFYSLIELFLRFGKKERYLESRQFVYDGLFGLGRSPCGNESVWDRTYHFGCSADRTVNAMFGVIENMRISMGHYEL